MLITSTEQLTPEYLTKLLRAGGFLDRGGVAGVNAEFTKTLHVSVVARLAVNYSADAPLSAPEHLFLKMSGSEALRGDAGVSEKEVAFYQTIARETPDPPFIRCLDAVYSGEAGRYHLLLEDLSRTHYQPEVPSPPSEKMSRAAVESLAELHAFWREHPQLGKGIGTLFDEDGLRAFVDGVEKNIVAFVDFLGDRLSQENRRIYERLIAARFEVWGRLTDARGLTVTHGDMHWWNFLYPHDASTHKVLLFDWQLWHVDVGARDLAFLVALGGFAEPRPAIEPDLVDCYYDALISNGVKAYSRADLWDDYRWAALRNLNIPVIFWSQGREDELWSVMLDRAMASYKNLKCSELLGT